MQRSGTTLAGRLLDNHPDMSVLSQPFPQLYVETKRAFLHERLGPDAASTGYPVDPLFGEDRYSPDDVTAFLGAHAITAGTVGEVFAGMAGYSGQLTPPDPGALSAALGALPAADLAGWVAHLDHALSDGPEVLVHGSKEVMCEEFLPHLVARGFVGVVVVRDPRAVVASLNHGRGRDWTGRLKPLLFNLRSWRKSVAYALHLRATGRVALVSYEGMVADPASALAPVADLLGLTPFGDDAFELDWTGNSSHGDLDGVASTSVDRWRSILSPATARFIEASCLPEMRLLGMHVDLGPTDVPALMADFEDPYPLERPELAGHTGPDAVARELERLALLRDPDRADDHRLFAFPDVRDSLARACETIGE